MKTQYGSFTKEQISETKKALRRNIFFLLLCVDASTACEYKNVNVNKCFDGLLYKINGLNELLMNQAELVQVMSLLVAAKMEYNNLDFNYSVYRKLILDAGAEIMKLKEV